MSKNLFILVMMFVIVSLSCQKENKNSNTFNEGMRYYDNGKYDEAIIVFTNVLNVEPKNTDALYYRAFSNIALRNFETALTDIEKFIEINPNYGEAIYARGAIRINLKNYEGAFFDFEKACELGIINACKALNDQFPDDVQKEIVKNKLYGTMVNDFLTWGEKDFNEGKYHKAIVNYNKALILQPNNSILYGYRAVAYEKLGEYNSAIKDYSKAIELDTNFGEAYFGRALIYITIKNYENACSDLNEAEKLGIKLATKVKGNYCK